MCKSNERVGRVELLRQQPEVVLDFHPVVRSPHDEYGENAVRLRGDLERRRFRREEDVTESVVNVLSGECDDGDDEVDDLELAETVSQMTLAEEVAEPEEDLSDDFEGEIFSDLDKYEVMAAEAGVPEDFDEDAEVKRRVATKAARKAHVDAVITAYFLAKQQLVQAQIQHDVAAEAVETAFGGEAKWVPRVGMGKDATLRFGKRRIDEDEESHAPKRMKPKFLSA